MTPQTLNRLKLIGIGVLAALPVVASYVLYWFWTPERHTNYGALVTPQPFPDIPLRTLDGKPFSFASLHGRWILLVVDSGRCELACKETLWKVRQVRQAQGKEMNRVERVWLIDDDHPPDGETVAELAGPYVVRGSAQSIASALPAEQSYREHVYLIDPLGNLMLRFPARADAKKMITDLTRLLKYSRAG